mgnify:CR=1 FL=1
MTDAASRFPKLQVMDRPMPKITKPDEVLLEVKACGICGSDLRRWKEGPPKGLEGVVPGHEAAGVVLEVGEGRRRPAPRDGGSAHLDARLRGAGYCGSVLPDTQRSSPLV